MLNIPFLSKCSDRSSLPKTNETNGSPEQWFDNKLLTEISLFGLSFDFFVNWSLTPPELTPEVWIKRILSPGVSYLDFTSDLEKNLENHFGKQYLTHLALLSSSLALQVSLVIFDDNQDWNNPSSKICLVSFSATGEISSELIGLDKLKENIQLFSGGKISIGSKGLIFGTSNLECFLSRTDSLYPGDMDLLLVDKDSKPVAILEFKKHSIAGDISGQKLSNYYPYPDKRKYDRLAIFRAYVLEKSSQDIPIIVVYYPTTLGAKQYKMEILTGNAGDLKAYKSGLFPLPEKKTADAYMEAVKLLPKIIAQHKKA